MFRELQSPATAEKLLTATSVSQVLSGQNEEGTDIKLRRQAKNKLKKEATKRVREEELRRKLYEPKDQRIRVVQRSELDKIRNPTNIISALPVCTVPNITASDFPSLGEKKPFDRAKNKSQSSTPVALQTGNWPLIPVSTSECTNSSSQDLISTTPNSTPPRKPKRNAPIKIEVLSALKKSKAVTSVQSSKPKPKKDSPQLAGNQLDASKPTRNKGKKREVPKDKKPTSLKLVILQEREIKRLVVKESTSSLLDRDGLVHGLLDETNSMGDGLIKGTGEPHSINELSKPSEPQDITRPEDATCEVNIGENTSCLLALDNDQLKENDQSDDPTIPAKLKIHSRKFREYCSHMLSAELDVIVSALVKDIVKFQDRLYFNDPIKAHAKRRFVLGFRETRKYLDLKKIKLLIIAPDLERVQSAGGIDDTVEELKLISAAQEVPCIFALGRKILKKLTNKSFKIAGISCMGVLNYEGTHDNFNAIQALLPKLQAEYLEKTSQEDRTEQLQIPETEITKIEESEVNVNSEVVASFLQKLTTELSKQ